MCLKSCISSRSACTACPVLRESDHCRLVKAETLAGNVQAVAAQHQLQYQAAAMQAQAMQAAAANAAWNQGNNPYLSGLCFPYNLYGAAAPQQLYAAYARSAIAHTYAFEIKGLQSCFDAPNLCS